MLLSKNRRPNKLIAPFYDSPESSLNGGSATYRFVLISPEAHLCGILAMRKNKPLTYRKRHTKGERNAFRCTYR